MKSTTLLLLSAAFISGPAMLQAQYTGISDAQPGAVHLSGNTKTDGWYNFTTSTKVKNIDGAEYTIPGNIGYPTALASSGKWTSPIVSQVQSDASHKASFNKISNGDGSGYDVGYDLNGIPKSLAYFNPDGTAKAGAVWKKANGTAGSSGYGAIPSGDSLYQISFSNEVNARQSTVGVFEANPLVSLKNVVLQIEIGPANGYDFWNHSVDGVANNLALGSLDPSSAFPQITLTLTDNSVVTLAADYASLLAKGFNGTAEMPTGPGGELVEEPIFINLYGFQWDLSEYSNIASFNVTWTMVEHTQMYAVRLDQSDVFNQAIPEPSTWVLALAGIAFIAVRARGRMLRRASA